MNVMSIRASNTSSGPGNAPMTSVMGYMNTVRPALELALADAHEAGDERAVRILHAVLTLLDDPGLR